MDLRRTCAIVGAYEHPLRRAPEASMFSLAAESALEALEQAGLTMKDVDGLYWCGIPLGLQGFIIGDYLNITPKIIDTSTYGGGVFELFVNHAQSMIVTGKAKVCLILYGSTALSQGAAFGAGARIRLAGAAGSAWGLQESFEDIYGTNLINMYALVAQRHMYAYGTTSEQLAEIAMAARKHAGLNPYAMYRDPLTVADVVKSPVIASPLHRLDCCVISDGGGAIVVVAPEVAKSVKTKPVWVLGASEAQAHTAIGKRDFTFTAGVESGQRAFAAAGVTPKDIDMAMLYDSFTITVLTALEDLGFCKKGEGGDFVSGGRIALGGQMPINTDGGGLSSTHPGQRGIFLLIEAVRQLRGDFAGTPRQVPDCKIALCHGVGGFLSTRHASCTAILARD